MACDRGWAHERGGFQQDRYTGIVDDRELRLWIAFDRRGGVSNVLLNEHEWVKRNKAQHILTLLREAK